MMKIFGKFLQALNYLKHIPPLLFRLTLAYGFYEPGIKKIQNIESTASWFASMNYPFPLLNVYLAATTELSGVVLLTLGLATRLISIPLMFTMIIAITTVHWKNGYSASNGGFEIPFYYFLMLFCLLVYGAGKFSLDYLISKKRTN